MENGPREKLLNEGITSLKDDELLNEVYNLYKRNSTVLYVLKANVSFVHKTTGKINLSTLNNSIWFT